MPGAAWDWSRSEGFSEALAGEVAKALAALGWAKETVPRRWKRFASVVASHEGVFLTSRMRFCIAGQQ